MKGFHSPSLRKTSDLAAAVMLSAVLLFSASAFLGFTPMSGKVQFAEAHQDVTAPGGTTACTTVGFNPSLAVSTGGIERNVFTRSDVGKTAVVTLTLSDSNRTSDCSYENDFTQGGTSSARITTPDLVSHTAANATFPILCIGGNRADLAGIPPGNNPNNCSPAATRVASQTLLPANWTVNEGDCPGKLCTFTANAPVFPHRNTGDTPIQQIVVTATIPFASTNLTKSANVTAGGAPLPVGFTYIESNDGGTDIYNATVTDDKCSPVAFVSGDDGDGILNPGESWTFTCTTTYPSPGVYTNTADAHGFTGPEDDPSKRDISFPEDPHERATATVVVGDLTIVKECQPASQTVIDSTGTITWTIRVANGPAPQDVIVTDSQHGLITGLTHFYAAGENDTELIADTGLGAGTYSDTANATGNVTGPAVPSTAQCSIANPLANPPVGGEILGIDATSLLLAGAFVNAYWIVPAIVGIVGITLGVLKFGFRRSEQP